MVNPPFKTVVIDDEIRTSEFENTRQFIRQLIPKPVWIPNLRSGLDHISQHYYKYQRLLLFLDLRFQASDLAMELFCRELMLLAKFELFVCVVSNYIGDCSILEIPIGYKISKLQLGPGSSKARDHQQTLKSLLFDDHPDRVFRCASVSYPILWGQGLRDIYKAGKSLLKATHTTQDLCERAIHKEIQRLILTPRHEWIDNDSSIWSQLFSVIDYPRFMLLNPMTNALYGVVRKVTLKRVDVCWDGGQDQSFDYRNFPREISKAQKGDRLSVEFKKHIDGRIEWISCRVFPKGKWNKREFADKCEKVKSLAEMPKL
jgi:hypothetical protein